MSLCAPIELDVEPISAPRQTRRDIWRPSPHVIRYRAFRDKVRAQLRARLNAFPCEVDLTFIIAMPKSWSAKKHERMVGRPHQQKPDIDNLVKALLDSAMDEDEAVWNVSARKLWGIRGHIILKGLNVSNGDLFPLQPKG